VRRIDAQTLSSLFTLVSRYSGVALSGLFVGMNRGRGRKRKAGTSRGSAS